MEYGLIGERLSHSFSKEIHALLGNDGYMLHELRSDELERFMRERNFRGINVTVPYKEAVIPYPDELSPEARRIGAVNTVINRGGRLTGYNTDYDGLRRLVLKNTDPAGKTVLILGSGGTSKTALAVFEDLGAERVFRVSRTGKQGCMTYEQVLENAAAVDIIANTTPCGMYPEVAGKPVEISAFPNLRCVIDAVYNPLRTELVLDARDVGIAAEGGLYMLTAQAVRAAELFTDEKISDTELDRVYRTVLKNRENIVLIGMPGCGKSTVGAQIADITGRGFVDTDAEIVSRIGCSIAEFFKTHGETAFRDIEEQVIRECARPTGRVIATGGGAVLRDSNVRALRSNGKLVFIDRPTDELTPTDSRPLAGTREALSILFSERYEKYMRCAEIRVHAEKMPRETAERVLYEFNNL